MRSKHNLSHYRLLTGNMGKLIPIMVQEVLPGDTFKHSTTALLRVATLVAPLMHPVNVRVHTWFVPSRLLQEDWEDFITGVDPNATLDTITLDTGDVTYAGSLWDHFGLVNSNGLTVNAHPFRAYNMIFNEFYRDQDIDSEVSLDSQIVQNCRWEKDYFTTARADAQMGDAITIPFATGTNAPVKGLGIAAAQNFTTGTASAKQSGETSPVNFGPNHLSSGVGSFYMQGTAGGYPNIYADLSATSGGGIDINDFRRSMAFQRLLENRNRYGKRYSDMLASWGVNSKDARLQRPEYLGGGKQTIAFSEVLATAEGSNTDVGDMAGHGIAALRTRSYKRFFEEHGVVLTLLTVRPKAMYMQQTHRQWLRRTKDDFWQKEYEVMGPQEVFVKELYGAHGNYTDVFGYNGRHDDYRHAPSYVSGGFRTSTYDAWHMARSFSASPSLNSDFLTCTPTNRVFAATSEDQLYIMASHSLIARRLVSHRARY